VLALGSLVTLPDVDLVMLSSTLLEDALVVLGLGAALELRVPARSE
jgi:hypothetical protein